MRLVPAIVLLLDVGTLAGCAATPPMSRHDVDDEALRELLVAFERSVDEARTDSELTWHHGWLGNIAVLMLGEGHCGLCYHWQEWVYVGVRPTADRLEWRAEGIALNVDRPGEHHAVIVFDPRQLSGANPLRPEPAEAVYVLDAWPRGRADAYLLADWLDLPGHRGQAVELEDLDAIPLLEFRVGRDGRQPHQAGTTG